MLVLTVLLGKTNHRKLKFNVSQLVFSRYVFSNLKIILSLRFPIYLYQNVPFSNCRADSASFGDAILCFVAALVSFISGLQKKC